MKTIKINFEDLFPGFKKEDNLIINTLRKKYNVVISDSPDYLFYSCFGYNHLKYDCIRIFYTGEDVSPDFNLCDYAIAFDDIKFGDRYLKYPLCCMCENYLSGQEKHIFTKDELASKTKFCNFIYSNANANPARREFFEKISEYKNVDSGGRYLNNIGGPVEDKIEFMKQYRFTIAFENDSVPDYATEKIMDAFAAKTIPIYWGDPKIASKFNTKSFVNCHEYASFDDVVKRVIEIDNTPDLFEQMLAEPIFENGVVPYEFSYEPFEKFLDYIIEQPIDKAKRISPYTFKRYYEKNLCEKIDAYNRVLKIFEKKPFSILYHLIKNHK